VALVCRMASPALLVTGWRGERVKTILIVTVDHKKPLPERMELSDVAAQRLYGWLYSQGVEASVNASYAQKEVEDEDDAAV
jgi:hypothetical protein